MFEFEDKVDHVFTHWRSVEFVNKSASFKPGVFSLHLLHHLLSEAADLGGALDLDVLGALVSAIRQVSDSRQCNDRGLDTALQLK